MCRAPSYVVASTKSSAIEHITNDFFDLIFLDLKIPSENGSMDSSPEHGRSILDIAVAVAPGTPIFILTGSSAEEFLPDLLQMGHQVDIWGQNQPLPVINLQKKHRLNNLEPAIAPYIHGCDAIFDIELQFNEELSTSEIRLIRIFTRSVGGVFCKISRIGGGLSGASVFKLLVTDSNGSKIHDSVAKIGSPAAIHDEVDRYDRLVVRLEASATPRKLSLVNHGAKNISGVFYGLANASESTAFSFMSGGSGQVINNVAASMNNWHSAAVQRRLTVADIRRCFISDEKFLSIRGHIKHDWIENFERSIVQVNWGCTHSDLHGYNILVSSNFIPVLIDYGDVGECACSRDPITLELSSLFHVQGPFVNSGWPSEKTASNWGKKQFIDETCPAPEFFLSCLAWAESVAVGKRERAAVAYGYLARQFKYEDCDHRLANMLIAGAKNLFDDA